MINAASDIIGKKIFFLYPAVSVQNHVISELIQDEYEVYIVKNHTRLVQVIKKYPDSILYINIDNGMPQEEWKRWISGISASVPELKIGVFTASTDEELREKYLKELNIACGYMLLKFDVSNITRQILETLSTMNVKGRRKYIRASTQRETTATINMPYNGDYLNGNIRDISVVGISCTFQNDPELGKNSLIKDIQLRLQTNLLKVDAVVFGSRMDGGAKIYVLLFTQRIEPDVRARIRKYIQQNLQRMMDLEIG